MSTHTQCSKVYRQHYMQGHEQQCHASMMAMRYLMTSYQGAVVRHRKRLIQALKQMEGKL